MIDRRILRYSFTKSDFPHLTCPRCHVGQLKYDTKPEEFEPAHSKNEHSSIAWDPEWICLRLAGTLICSNPACGEMVVYSANGSYSEDVNEYGEQIYNHFFSLKMLHPSPWIIALPEETPEPIAAPLQASFDSFWNNKPLCGNALRQAIEALLEHHGVRKLSENGSFQPLAKRIAALKSSKPEHSELFELFRPILNAGSHGETTKIDVLLDVYEALEIHLIQVFDDRSSRLAELKENLRNSQKGN